jgi:transpeptidase family protein/MecA-like transpeptidase family protein/penicillin-binding protein
MASNRRRGAHAAARVEATHFVGTRRATRPATAQRAAQQGGTGGKRVSGLRSRPPVKRVVAAAVVLAFAAVGFTGLLSSPSAEPTVQAFLLNWQQKSYAAAAALTTGDSGEVTSELRNAYRGLDAAAYYLSMGPITQSGDTAHARFSASVDLGQDGAPWVYNGHFDLKQVGSTWKVVWDPSVICPGLRSGLHLAMVSSAPQRKPLLDNSGQPLQVPTTAYVAGVESGRLRHPAATASALGRATGLEPTELLGWILAAPRASFQELVTFRPDQYRRIAHRLAKVPGLIVKPERLRLFTSIAPAVVGSVGTEVAGELRQMGIAYRPGATVGLSGLQRAYQSKLAGTATTRVITESASGHQVTVLKTWSGRPPTPVRTTINSGAQTAANQAVAAAGGSAAIVAVQASSGHILAVSQRAARGLPRIDPLAGRYQPGTAFTIVSTAALLASGLGVATPVRCTSVNDVGGRNFRNIPPVPNLGMQPTFAADFAHACGTAFSGLSERINARDLNDAAGAFGLRAEWGLPLPSFSGQVQASGGFAQVASDTIGQGTVQVSPLAMALVAAEVDSGAWHKPSLVTLPHDPPVTKAAKIARSDLGTLRSLMRGTVRSGAARAANLAGLPVYGQVGTAAYGTGKHHKWVSWFVGYRGNMAFAALEIIPKASTSAVQLAASFLASAPSG